jgi:hypothetical protein
MTVEDIRSQDAAVVTEFYRAKGEISLAEARSD